MGTNAFAFFVLFLVSLFDVLLGVVVFMRAKSVRLYRLFFYMTVWMGLWTILNGLYAVIRTPDARFALALLSYAAAAGLAGSFLYFTHELSNTIARKSLLRILVILLVAAGIMAVLPGVVANGVSATGKISTNPLPLALYGIAIIAALGTGILTLIQAIRSSRGSRRASYRILLFGLALGVVIGVIFNLALPILGNYDYVQLGPVGLLLFVMFSTYAIIRHGLFDIRMAFVRTLAYGLSVIVMAGIYFGLAYVASVTFFSDAATTGVSLSPINIFLALLLALIFQPIKQFFDHITNQIFYRDRYDSDKFIERLGDVLISTTQLRELLRHAAQEMGSTLKAAHVTFVIYRENRHDLIVGTGHPPMFSDSEREKLLALIERSGLDAIVVEEQMQRTPPHSSYGQVLRMLERHGVSLILPLSSTTGYVLLGEQKAGGYTRRDVRLLETISGELVIAIQNARSVQEVQDINTHLEQRINKATAELRRSNEKLKKLDATKDEFVSMASHQLRTPLTSIKGYISMVLDGDAGEITDQQRKLLKEAFASSERMVRLIGDFLNVSRLQTGKFIIDRKAVDLATLIRDEVDSIESMAATRAITLNYKGPKRFPTMQLDEDKIRQVVMNFIDNAIYYSRAESTIVVRLAQDGSDAVLEVHDHGIGVPKESLEKLFTKFFRAENARRQRPDGTGVGLYLAKRVITEHGGKLIVESTEGKGSVFGFRLPIR
ncbi:MAG TPA: ATP-binding protein [Patescibacteria group bacterium]|nr:ATP-binding protein [Patescibacteria group bacterium]